MSLQDHLGRFANRPYNTFVAASPDRKHQWPTAGPVGAGLRLARSPAQRKGTGWCGVTGGADEFAQHHLGRFANRPYNTFVAAVLPAGAGRTPSAGDEPPLQPAPGGGVRRRRNDHRLE